MEFKATVGENGRMILPAKVRKVLNISSGDQIVLLLDGEELKLMSLKQTVKNFQEVIKERNKDNISLVDTLHQSREGTKNE